MTRRDKKPVIRIEPKTDHELKIINNGTTKAGRSKGVLKEVHINLENRRNKKLAEIKENLSNLPSKRTKTLFTTNLRKKIASNKAKKIEPVEAQDQPEQYTSNDTYLKDWLGITKKIDK